MSHRRFILLALAILPGTAAAQFTTFIPPKTKVQDSVKAAVVAVQRAREDSITVAALTNMKTWVDSAAGIATPSTRVDSLVRADSLAHPVVVAESTTFRDGTKAPSTASNLPLLALIGAAALGLGIFLVAAPGRRDGA